MANELRIFQNHLGGRRTYTTPAAATVITDGVSNSTTTITSATAAFTAADVGATITGTDLPAAVYIASVTNGTTAVLSATATGTGSGRTWTINRHLVFHSAALAAMSTVGTTQHMMVCFDPDGMAGEPEVVKVTKHDAAATWAQIVRAQEGTTARAHTNSGGGADWIHGAFASDIGVPVLTTTLSSPGGVSPIAAGATSTIQDTVITGTGKFGTMIDAWAGSTVYGVTGTGSAAGVLEFFDSTNSVLLGAQRWHNQSTERTIHLSLVAKLWVPSETTITLRLRQSNDGGSSQSINAIENRLQINKTVY